MVTDLSKRLKDLGLRLDTSKATSLQSLFAYADMKSVPSIDCSNSANATQLFHECKKLETIEKFIPPKKASAGFSNTFYKCEKLRNIIVEGEWLNTVSFADSTELSADSIRSIIEHLSDTAQGKTLTLSKTAVENAIANGEFGGDTVYMTTDGAFNDYLYSNPIPLTAGQRIKIEAEWKEGYDIDSLDELDWWFDSTGDGTNEDYGYVGTPGYSLPRYYTATSDEQRIIGWYFDSNVAVSNIPIKIRVALVDEDGNELTGENLHSFVADTVTNPYDGVTLTITDDSWETLAASKPNWTISLV